MVMVMDEFSHHHLSHPSLNTLRTILIFHKKKTFVLVSFTILGSREKRWCLHGGKASTFFFFFNIGNLRGIISSISLIKQNLLNLNFMFILKR
jgi:hypothetical protein